MSDIPNSYNFCDSNLIEIKMKLLELLYQIYFTTIYLLELRIALIYLEDILSMSESLTS